MILSQESRRPIVVIDGLNIFTRHYIANPSMSDSGDPIGGLIGFLKNIRFLCERFNPSALAIAWEGGGSARRRAKDINYKGNRRPIKLNRYYDDLPDTYQNRDRQLLKMIQFIRMLPVIQVYVPDCEGDDIVSHMVRSTFRQDKCVIVSSDKDFYQCIDSRVHQWSPGRKKIMTPSTVLDEFGIRASNFCTTRAFVGDSSDNIEGVKGAGFKTMSKRFPELSEQEDVILEDLFELSRQRSEDKRSPALFERILLAQDSVKKNLSLMTLTEKNISATQALKIDGIIKNFDFSPNKFEFMKLFLREQIKNFDIDALWVSTRCLRKK